MSFNYLETLYTKIPELQESNIRIDDEFQDFASLNKYLYIIIDEWNRDYPLPILPNSIIVLEINCNYKFPLYNLQSSIEVLCIECEYNFPLENLPINLYQLELALNRLDFEAINKYPINLMHFIPESVKILSLVDRINQSSYNLPIGLKSLEFSSDTFKNEIVVYPPELEQLYLHNEFRNLAKVEKLKKQEQLEKYFNLINLPLSIRVLHLPNLHISNFDSILKRLIHLESLYIPNNCNQVILEYPQNLVKLNFSGHYIYKLVNLPSSLKYIALGWYNNSLEAVANSNIEHIDLHP